MSQIVTVPNAVLRQPTKPVDTLDARVLGILKDMENTLREAENPQGVGLAAPQIGLSLRIFMIRPTKSGPVTTFINPEIIKYSQRKIKPNSKDGVYEGCLSIPHHYAPLERSSSITIKYQTPILSTEGCALRAVQKTYSGFSAHVIQHETDHLNGILLIDRVLEQNAHLFKFEGKTWHEVTL